MPDITMCDGKGCPFRSQCERHMARPLPGRQAYFSTTPFRDGSCQFLMKTSPDKTMVVPVLEDKAPEHFKLPAGVAASASDFQALRLTEAAMLALLGGYLPEKDSATIIDYDWLGGRRFYLMFVWKHEEGYYIGEATCDLPKMSDPFFMKKEREDGSQQSDIELWLKQLNNMRQMCWKED